MLYLIFVWFWNNVLYGVLIIHESVSWRGLRTEDFWPGMSAGDPEFGAWGWSWYSLQWPVFLLWSLVWRTLVRHVWLDLATHVVYVMQHVVILCNMWRCSWNMWIYIWKWKVVWNFYDVTWRIFYWILARIICIGPGLLFWRKVAWKFFGLEHFWA